MRLVKILLFGSSIALLTLNLSANFIDPSYRYDQMLDNRSRSMQDVPGYTRRVIELSELKRISEKPLKTFDLHQVNGIIFDGLRHSDLRRIELYENWLLWILSFAYDSLGHTQNAHRIIAGGNAICSEAVAVLNHVAFLNGYPSRIIGLGGHVISEVFYKGRWIAVDPDFGITFNFGYHGLLKLKRSVLKDVLERQLTERGYPRSTAETYVEEITSTDDNVVFSPGAALSPRLDTTEKWAEVLKWVLPISILLLSLCLKLETRRHRAFLA